MKRISRRSTSHSQARGPLVTPAIAGSGEGALDAAKSRRAFLAGSARAAAGAAVVLATPKVASVALPSGGSSAVPAVKATVTKPSGPAPHEPVTAYVRDAQRNEVTVMAGTHETTYKDPALVKRLLDAAR